MSSPSEHRCSCGRYHPDSESIAACNQRQQQEGAKTAEKKPFQAAYPEPPSTKKAPKKRTRHLADTPEPEAGGSSLPESSPLQRKTVHQSTSPIQLFTPPASTRQSTPGSIIAAPERPDNILVPATPSSQMPSPGSTEVIPETPIDRLRSNTQRHTPVSTDIDSSTPPASSDFFSPQPGPSNWFQSSPRLRKSSNAPEVLSNTPAPASNDTNASTQTSSPTNDSDMAYTQKLRQSRNRLTTHLEASTALVNRLQARNTIQEADMIAHRALRDQAEADRDEARAGMEVERGAKKWLGWSLAMVIVALLVCVFWCWYNGPEMEYIRSRREAILREFDY